MADCRINVKNAMKEKLSEFLGKEADQFVDDIYDELVRVRDGASSPEDLANKIDALTEDKRTYVLGKRKQDLENIKKRKTIKERMEQYGSRADVAILDSIGDRSNNLMRNSNLGAGAWQHAYRDKLIGTMSEAFNKISGGIKILKNKTMDLDIYKEMYEPGSTGNVVAKDLAKAIRIVNDAIYEVKKDSGSTIRYLPNYIAQSHSVEKMMAGGEDGFVPWVKHILPRLSDKTFEKLPSNLSREEFLRDIYNNIIFGRDGTLSEEKVAKEILGKRLSNVDSSNRRVLHFKDGQAHYEYTKVYGEDNILEALAQSIHKASQKSGIMKVFGSDPELTIKSMFKFAEKRYRDTQDLSALDRLRDGQFLQKVEQNKKVLTGWASNSTGNLFHTVGTGLTTWNTLRALGATFAYLPTEMMNGVHLIKSTTGANYLDVVKNVTKNFVTTDRNDSKYLATFFEEYIRQESTDFRSGSLGAMTKAKQIFYKLNLEYFKTNRLKAAMAKTLSNMMADRINTDFASLPKQYRADLSTFGINEREWAMLNRAVRELPDKTKGIDSDSVLEIPVPFFEKYAELTNKTPEAARDLLAYKVSIYHTHYALRGTTTPGISTMGHITGGSRPDTIDGMLKRLTRQFRSFSLESGNNLSKIMLSDPDKTAPAFMEALKQGKGNHRAMAGYALNMLAMGYATVAFRAHYKGEDMPDPADFQTWIKSAAAGNVFGIYGDMMFGSLGVRGENVLKTMVGPTFSNLYDIGEVTKDALAGKNVAKRKAKLIMKNIPGNNLIWGPQLYNYMFMDEARKAVGR